MHTVPDYKVDYPEQGSDIVEQVTWEVTDSSTQLGRVRINEKQYFDNVPLTAWEFYIGGYQPAQKWLKDRKGRKLSSDDINHYEGIIAILMETNKLMKEIDR